MATRQEDAESPEARRWRYVFYSLGVGFLLMFGVMSVLQNGPSYVLLVAAVVCLIASRLNDLTKFKFSATGVEGEMREAIADAKATVVQLQFLAEQQAKSILHLMQSEGRWGGGDPRLKDQMRLEILSTLRQIGISENRIAEVTSIEYPWIAFDYALLVTRGLSPPTQDQATRWNEFFHSAERQKGVGSEPSPEELRTFLAEMNVISPEVDERLKDYAYFVKHKRHRRPEVWGQRFS